MKGKGLAQHLAPKEYLESVPLVLNIFKHTSKVLFLSSGSAESDFIFQQRDIKISQITNTHIYMCTFVLDFVDVTK